MADPIPNYQAGWLLFCQSLWCDAADEKNPDARRALRRLVTEAKFVAETYHLALPHDEADPADALTAHLIQTLNDANAAVLAGAGVKAKG